MSKTDTTTPLRLGFGATGAWGKAWFSPQKAERLIQRALERGVTHFDTAGFYAGGTAETRLGNALKQTARSNIKVSSKIGTRIGNGGKLIKDFSVATIRADVNASLKRLGREQIDILYLHGPTHTQIDGTRNVMSMLKQEGKIGAIGVCGIGDQLEYAMNTKAVDAVMGLYNAFDHSHGPHFARAKAEDLHTVAIAPLGQALYRRGFLFPKSSADIWYLARAIGKNRKELKHARHVAANALESLKPLTPAGAMLGFVLANTDIDIAMTNTTRLVHLDESITAATGSPLEANALAQLQRLERTKKTG